MLSRDIAGVVLDLFRERGYEQFYPIRSVGIQCSQLIPRNAPTQLDLFGDNENRMAIERLEEAVHDLQSRFGAKSIGLGIMLTNEKLKEEDPREHFQPAQPYYAG